jgi:hypothetical protein
MPKIGRAVRDDIVLCRLPSCYHHAPSQPRRNRRDLPPPATARRGTHRTCFAVGTNSLNAASKRSKTTLMTTSRRARTRECRARDNARERRASPATVGVGSRRRVMIHTGEFRLHDRAAKNHGENFVYNANFVCRNSVSPWHPSPSSLKFHVVKSDACKQ